MKKKNLKKENHAAFFWIIYIKKTIKAKTKIDISFRSMKKKMNK